MNALSTPPSLNANSQTQRWVQYLANLLITTSVTSPEVCTDRPGEAPGWSRDEASRLLIASRGRGASSDSRHPSNAIIRIAGWCGVAASAGALRLRRCGGSGGSLRDDFLAVTEAPVSCPRVGG